VELFPFHWDMVGQPEADVVIGKGNGRDTIAYRLRAIGAQIPSDDPRVDAILAHVKAASLKKHALLSDEEFRRIASRILSRGNGAREAAHKKPASRRVVRRARGKRSAATLSRRSARRGRLSARGR
jgi:hypothetical protein